MNNQKENVQEQSVQTEEEPVCGIIMPISPLDGCTTEHWEEVQKILSEAIKDAGYKPNLVSNANDVGIIQKRIIQNIYDNDIVVCDVSGKNPNVMFELGMRLAFDKPAIIIIDDKTNYSFDTSPIEHLSYPRDLRYYDILKFKEKLANKIKATVDKARSDDKYTTFLKNFGEFKVATIEHREGSIDDVVLSKLEDLSNQLYDIKRRQRFYYNNEVKPVSESRHERINNIFIHAINSYCEEKNMKISELAEICVNDEELENVLRYIMDESPTIRHLYGPTIARKRIKSILSID